MCVCIWVMLGLNVVRYLMPCLVCNVYSFGAVGNGIADDTTAIQRAVESCASRGGGLVMISNVIISVY